MQRYFLYAMVAVSIGITTWAQPCEPAWEHRAGPVRGSGSLLAFDAQRGYALQYGGVESFLHPHVLRSTQVWKWDGAMWSLVSWDMPSLSGEQRLCYDSTRGVILFVGFNTDDLFETWSFDGSAWQLLGTGGPTPRSSYSLSFDTVRGVAVLFGGRDSSSGYYGETWEWDGSAWALVSQSGPAPRYDHGAAFDAGRGRTVLFGGWASEWFGDTWEWDGIEWVQRAADGPTPRSGHMMTYHPGLGRVLLAGGQDGPAGWSDVTDDMWAWDGEQWTELSSTLPSKRSGAGMTYDSVRGELLLHGGTYTPWGRLWAWAGGEWSLRHDSGPSPRKDSAIAYDSTRGVSVLFGGWQNTVGWASYDTWEWDGSQWLLRGYGYYDPGKRSGHALVFDSARDVIVMTGGAKGLYSQHANQRADTWTWDGVSWTEHPGTPWLARERHGMVFDSHRSVCVLFGGSDQYRQRLGDTWEWDGSDWVERDVSGPSARYDHAMAFDAGRGVTVVYGGLVDGGQSDETWEYDGQSWTLVSTGGGPPDLVNREMVYVPEIGACVFVGEEGDLWIWDGNTWQQLSNQVLERGRYGSAIAFDTARSELILTGGSYYVYNLAETRTLGVPFEARVAVQPQDAAGYPGESLRFEVVGRGAKPIEFQWYRDGVALGDGPTGTGSTLGGTASSTLSVEDISEADEGAYWVEVANDCDSDVSDPVSLDVLCPADFNADGIADTRDFVAFLQAWAAERDNDCSAGDCRADLDNNGVVDTRDFVEFLNIWAAGC